MYRLTISITLLLLSFVIYADDVEHGMYMLTVKNAKGDFNQINSFVVKSIESSGFRILADRDVSTPDNVREEGEDLCGYKGKLIVFTNDDYINMLTSFGNKYLVASFLRIGIHETNEGIQIIIADPETINRIIFNDLDDENYEKAVMKTLPFKSKIITTLHSLKLGTNVEEIRDPKRSTEDLREASRDMFMMVGPMTFFDDEDQFPKIYSQKNENGSQGLENLKQKMFKNIENFQPTEDDTEYRWTKEPKEDLKWKVVGKVISPDKKAIMFGLTRNRTEAVSFYIVGDETEENKCPGLDHLTAYPIEVLLMIDDGEDVVYTPREMFRMDMYFWDAGMGAFMNHMSMPDILDESIYKALFAKEKD
ncbi:MAG: hypothetical protein KJN64_11410 [Ignavibacteria bacterium]|nr:hypothetical protein [Ignavibacteria bacterium]MBT8391245.1 hypothetical protein [Ignavibacteria bacterium]NNJ51604.1 hypothetical protein [Ignavibacteriaceae bacterium]NNL21305.1 hypothetical protein [Ignavibacteriaceae bacterium]